MNNLTKFFGGALMAIVCAGSAFAGQIEWGPWKKYYTNEGQFAYQERVGDQEFEGQYKHWAEFRISPRFQRSVRIYNLTCNGNSDAGDTVIGVNDEWQDYKFTFIDDVENCNWNWDSTTL